jgi:hypothetical protein
MAIWKQVAFTICQSIRDTAEKHDFVLLSLLE